MTRKPVLILGLNGTIGSHIARALLRDGRSLRAVVRDREAARQGWHGAAIEWVEGDAMDAATVIGAGAGVGTIVHAVSPPRYRDWDKSVLPMIDNSIAAARAAGGARIVLPGTIYNYDPARTPVVDETTVQTPLTEKGRIRAELERRLEAASGDCPALILRAGDYIGADARSSWFASAMVRPGGPVTRMINPGKHRGHSWAYLPDLAEAFSRLLAQEERLRPFEQLQFEGIWDEDGTRVADAIRRVVGRHLPEHAFPWWLMRLLAPFGGFPGAVKDIEPYWRHPVRLDNRRLLELLGTEPRTPLDTAIRETLSGMGCLPLPPAMTAALAA